MAPVDVGAGRSAPRTLGGENSVSVRVLRHRPGMRRPRAARSSDRAPDRRAACVIVRAKQRLGALRRPVGAAGGRGSAAVEVTLADDGTATVVFRLCPPWLSVGARLAGLGEPETADRRRTAVAPSHSPPRRAGLDAARSRRSGEPLFLAQMVLFWFAVTGAETSQTQTARVQSTGQGARMAFVTTNVRIACRCSNTTVLLCNKM